jgi:methyl-accepting chemotaxis protein
MDHCGFQEHRSAIWPAWLAAVEQARQTVAAAAEVLSRSILKIRRQVTQSSSIAEMVVHDAHRTEEPCLPDAHTTGEIRKQIAEIQTPAGEAVQTIESIAQTIEEIGRIASSIASAVEEQGSASHEIARNVHEAASGTAM